MTGMLRGFVRLNVAAVVLTASLAWGQAASSVKPRSVADVLHQMSDRADVIFMGQVLAVHLPNGASPASGVVEIQFRVDEAIRGCKTGQPYVLREWGGLWAGGSGRYRVGQRLLMLLHAPSAGGMSSPVGGLDGAIPIRQSAVGAPIAGNATPPPALPIVDLRWLGTKLPRAISYRNEVARSAGEYPQLGPGQRRVETAVTSGSGGGDTMILPLGYTSAADASIPAQQASVNVVLGLLTSWQKAQHDAP